MINRSSLFGLVGFDFGDGLLLDKGLGWEKF